MCPDAWIEPTYKGTVFNCPSCGFPTGQEWYFGITGQHDEIDYLLDDYTFSICVACDAPAIWFQQCMVYPAKTTAPKAHPSMPDDTTGLFEEARSIHTLSPRATAALLRLCVDKLCDDLGAIGNTLNAKIGSLVEQGLPDVVQKALDSVRVVGNDAIHPGEILDTDTSETVSTLFSVINFIVERMIAVPKQVEDLYQGLPETVRADIQRRDGEQGG